MTGQARQVRRRVRIDGGSGFAATKGESKRVCRTDHRCADIAFHTGPGMFDFLAVELVSCGIFERERARLTRWPQLPQAIR